MHPVLIVTLALVGLLLLAYAVLCLSVFRFAFLRKKKQGRAKMESALAHVGQYRDLVANGIASVDAMPCEEIIIRSQDGLSLYGRLYGEEGAEATIILFHGYRSFGENDFNGIFPYYIGKRGYRILLVDQRAHGKSEGRYITFGIHERRDGAAWAHYLAKRFGPDHKIVLDGMSMGAATVMMALGEPLPPNVVGIIADCGYSSPMDILRHVGTKMKLPLLLIMPTVIWLCRVLAHFDPCETSAREAVAASPLPKLFVHGKADDFVPYAMGKALFDIAQEPKYMVSVDEAGHGMSFLCDQETVLAALGEFLDKIVER